MDKKEQIRQRIKEMAKQASPDSSMLAQVRSVDKSENTCDLYDEDTELDYYDVRLQPVIDGNKFITVYPKVDSWVLALRIEDSDDWVIVSVGEADSWSLKIGNRTIELDSDGLLIQNGTDTLKDCLKLIIEGVQGIVVVQGTNPNYEKLAQAMIKVTNLLK